MFAVMIMHPELVNEQQSTVHFTRPSETGNETWSAAVLRYKQAWTSEDQFMGLLIALSSFAITIMLVYGTIKGQPGYLMPFFCLQVFDFCISCLTVVGCFSYVPNIKSWIAAQENFPMREELLRMNNDWLMLLTVLSFVMMLTIKAYLIGMVWSCYKYLGEMQNRPVTGTNRTFDTSNSNSEDTELLLPPKYEDVIRLPPPSSDEPPPPPYTTQ